MVILIAVIFTDAAIVKVSHVMLVRQNKHVPLNNYKLDAKLI
jgi:hypothetical protein